MVESAVTILLEPARELLRNKQFEKALTELDRIRYSQLSEEDYAHYCILFCEVNLWLGNITASLDGDDLCSLLNHSISYYRSNYNVNRNVEHYALSKYLLGWFYSLQSDYLTAKEELSEAYSSFKLCNNISALPKVLNRLAHAQFK